LENIKKRNKVIFTIEKCDFDITKKCLVLFYTTWMPKAMFNRYKLMLEKIQEKYPEANIYCIDVENKEFEYLIKNFNVRGVPRLCFFEDEKLKKNINGMPLYSALKAFCLQIYGSIGEDDVKS